MKCNIFQMNFKDDQDAATKCLYRLISSHYKDLLQDKGANVPLERKKEFADVRFREVFRFQL